MRKWLGRLGSLILFLAVALCFVPSLIPPFLDRIYYRGPPGGHFDGERFFNPGPAAPSAAHGGPMRFVNRWLGDDQRADWPVRVPVRPTVPPRSVAGGEMRVTWIGHATVLVQTEGVNILTDPIWSERVSPFSFVGPTRVRAPGVRFEDLPRIDLVLVSHNHYDHMDLPTLKRLWDRDRPLIVTSLGNDAILRRAGIGAAGLDWNASRPFKAGTVSVERNHHWSSRWGTDRNRALWSVFSVRMPGGNIYYAGDTGFGDGSWATEAVARSGPYRLAILPVGAYLPRDVMRNSHMDPDEAVQVFERLGAQTGLGVHWGTFRLTFEAINDPPKRLAAALKRRGIERSRFFTTEVARTFSVPPVAPQAR